MKKVFYFFIRHPYILLTMILIVILTIVLVVISVRRLYSGSLRVVVAPSTADVFVNNQLFKNGEYEGLRIGTVHVDIVSEGFESESFDLELLPDETAVIYRCLASDDDSLKQNDDYEAHCACFLSLASAYCTSSALISPSSSITPVAMVCMS